MVNTSYTSGIDMDNMDDSIYFSPSPLNYSDDYGDWCEPDEQEETIVLFQTCVFGLIFLLGIVGNCLVIATFALYRRARLRSMTDIFLLHLALADLLLLLTLPLQGAETHRGWIFSVPLCKATRACYAINTYSGLLLLACISVDRYLVVVRAQEMLRLRSQFLRGAKMVAVGVWVAAVLLSFPEILFSNVSETDAGNGTKFYYCGMIVDDNSGRVKMATNGTIIAAFCVSLVVMVTCYSRIAVVLWEGAAQRRGKRWHRQRTLKLMVALVLVFLLFQLPYTVVLSRKMAGQFCGLLVEYVTCTLAYARCCLNPILYALVGVRFRNDVLRLLHDCHCGCGCRPHLAPNAVSSASMSPSSPALTVCSPTSHERSYSSAEVQLKFQFPKIK